MQQVFSYIVGTINHGICYNQQTSITGYTDWAEDRDTNRSTTGFIFILNGDPFLGVAFAKEPSPLPHVKPSTWQLDSNTQLDG
jgi:hypothetical protein